MHKTTTAPAGICILCDHHLQYLYWPGYLKVYVAAAALSPPFMPWIASQPGG